MEKEQTKETVPEYRSIFKNYRQEDTSWEMSTMTSNK